MPKFSYVVKDRDGKSYKNVTDALSQRSLVEKLQKQGYFIVSVEEIRQQKQKKTFGAKKKKKFAHKKVKLNDLLVFARQLATMLESGVSMIRSLDVIQAQAESEALSNILKKVKDDVEQGGSLSQALAKHPKTFNQFWVSLLEVGEASGTVPAVLQKLTFYLEQQAAFRSTIISGLIYPAILFCISILAIIFFALVIGPRFEEIFVSMNVQLPAITKILLGIFKFIKSKFMLLVFGIGAVIFMIRKFLKTYQGRLMFEKFMFTLPQAGDVYRLIIVERFSSQLAILLDSGVPILYALDISERLVNNNTCALIISQIKEGVKEGELLVHPMERSGFFPPMAIQMITVGEETGELSKMLKHVAAFYQEQVETFMKRFSTIVEPFMLVFMGAVIGTIVLAMFLPMFDISRLGGTGG